MVAPLREQFQEYTIPPELNTGAKIVAVIIQDKEIDDNLKRQIINQTLCTSRLFLLTYILQCTSNWKKVFFLLPNCQFLHGSKQVFS